MSSTYHVNSLQDFGSTLPLNPSKGFLLENWLHSQVTALEIAYSPLVRGPSLKLSRLSGTYVQGTLVKQVFGIWFEAQFLTASRCPGYLTLLFFLWNSYIFRDFNLYSNYSISTSEFCLMFFSQYLHLFLLATGEILPEKHYASPMSHSAWQKWLLLQLLL